MISRTFCPKCGSSSVSSGTGDGKIIHQVDPYTGENKGLGEYVRSKSHFNELVKKKGFVEVGSERTGQEHHAKRKDYR